MARYGFLTIRASDAEPDMFEKLLIIFLPMLEVCPEYAYHVEHDHTPSKHLHVFFTLHKHFADASKITQYFLKKPMKQLRQTFMATDWTHCWKMIMVPHTKEDEMKALGYVLKENDGRRKIHKYSAQRCLEAINYYILTQRLDKMNTLDNDWKYITVKNIHNRIEHFCAHKNKSLHDEDIKEHMVLDKTSWVQISIKQYNLALAELRYHNSECEDSRLMIKSHGSPFMEDIERLQEEVKNLEQKLLIKQRQYSTLQKSKIREIRTEVTPPDYEKYRLYYRKHCQGLT